ncbi:uncharacterized protein ymp [Drosophila kikkawai]|uniref:Uncharacterized protein ymp n=1 Tax=Drosophila kikkawai TaxID=30033 RepID=A0A6P4ISL1_DROKI|nr:uncharacterized protein LOC108081052 [Drosophila kikkawai]
MALRLISLARMPSLLVPKVKPAQPQVRYLLKRDRLVPFVDEVPTVFSIPAIKHHWGVIPIIGVCTFALIMKITVIILMGFKKDDVWFTKGSARCEDFETRSGPWYKAKSRKWGGRDDYPVPAEALLARQGDTNGPPFPADDDDDDSDNGLSATEVAVHVGVTTGVIGVATFLAA